ncbi:gas vesicle protein [Phaeacidiphilus oryzae]|uniref:gas vesicle protein n=1 Tax=Phaeacidiphilus oryzae TaxID=348818 RepID=UPI000A887AAE
MSVGGGLLSEGGFLEEGEAPPAGRPIALVDLLDRLLAGGVVLAGDLSISIADVELVRVSLRALVMSVDESLPPWRLGGGDDRGRRGD